MHFVEFGEGAETRLRRCDDNLEGGVNPEVQLWDSEIPAHQSSAKRAIIFGCPHWTNPHTRII